MTSVDTIPIRCLVLLCVHATAHVDRLNDTDAKTERVTERHRDTERYREREKETKREREREREREGGGREL